MEADILGIILLPKYAKKIGKLFLEFTEKILLGKRIRILQNIFRLEMHGFQLNPVSFKKCYLYNVFRDIREINIPDLLHYLFSRWFFFNENGWCLLVHK